MGIFDFKYLLEQISHLPPPSSEYISVTFCSLCHFSAEREVGTVLESCVCVVITGDPWKTGLRAQWASLLPLTCLCQTLRPKNVTSQRLRFTNHDSLIDCKGTSKRPPKLARDSRVARFLFLLYFIHRLVFLIAQIQSRRQIKFRLSALEFGVFKKWLGNWLKISHENSGRKTLVCKITLKTCPGNKSKNSKTQMASPWLFFWDCVVFFFHLSKMRRVVNYAPCMVQLQKLVHSHLYVVVLINDLKGAQMAEPQKPLRVQSGHLFSTPRKH